MLHAPTGFRGSLLTTKSTKDGRALLAELFLLVFVLFVSFAVKKCPRNPAFSPR